MKIKTIALGTALMLSTAMPIASFAQAPEQNPNNPEMRADRKAEMESKRLDYLIQKLNLQGEQAKKFATIYDQHQKIKADLTAESRKLTIDLGINDMRNLDSNMIKIAALPDSSAQKVVACRVKLADLEKQYLADLQDILNAQKIIILFDAERAFQREMMRTMRNNRMQKPETDQPDQPIEQPKPDQKAKPKPAPKQNVKK